MNRFAKLAMLTILGAGLIGGCASDTSETVAPSKGTTAKEPSAKSTETAKLPAVEYQEIPAGKRLVVAGTKEGAEKARSTGKPTSYVTEVGFGVGGQTVYFENKPEGMEKALKAEFLKRHPELAK